MSPRASRGRSVDGGGCARHARHVSPAPTHTARPGAVSLREVLARRGADRIVLFHSDHFEPWGRRGRTPPAEWRARGLDRVHRFAERMRALPHARRLGLFYLPELDIVAARDGVIGVPGDAFGIAPREPGDEAAIRAGFAALPADCGFDWQVHFHHERLTWNRRSRAHPFAEAFAVHDPALDRQRFDIGLAEALRRIRNDTGRALDRWFFVHGLWALNASDLDVCSITDEIARLKAAGCIGDFTFPAGRQHCDPPFDEPSLVRPVDAPKGYAAPTADPRPPHAGGADRFFIWASRDFHPDASLDFEAAPVAANFANPEPWAERLLLNAVQRGSTLYVKTHAHSLATFYFDQRSGRPGGQFPHEHDGVKRLVGMFEAAAAAVGGRLDHLTPSEVHDELVAEAAEAPSPWGYAEAGLSFPRAAIERAEAATFATLADRLERMGEEEGGLGAHFRALVERGRVIQPHEVELLNVVQRVVPPTMPIVALRSAVGVVPLALALGGREVVAIEGDRRRNAAQAAVADVVRGREPGIEHRFAMRKIAPAAVAPADVRGRCLLLTDMETALTGEGRAHLHTLFGEAAIVIFDAGRLHERRRGDEAASFGASVTGAGGRRAVPLLDLGDDARYFLLDNRPAGEAAGLAPASAADGAEALDREVLAFMAERFGRMGEEASGLYPYYVHRVRTKVGLPRYERALFRRLESRAAVFHAGIGIGTLTVALARAGVRCMGFEFDDRRFAAAADLKAALAPSPAYELRHGRFPAALRDDDRTRDATLLFTNVGRGWSDADLAAAVRAMRRFSSTVLDLRQFGWTRDRPDEREALATDLAAEGFVVQPLELDAHNCFYVELRPASRGKPAAGWLRRLLGGGRGRPD